MTPVISLEVAQSKSMANPGGSCCKDRKRLALRMVWSVTLCTCSRAAPAPSVPSSPLPASAASCT
eukprot:6087787-Alexandrium_andersonii.AAC.1